jgi:hypothetical protein
MQAMMRNNLLRNKQGFILCVGLHKSHCLATRF